MECAPPVVGLLADRYLVEESLFAEDRVECSQTGRRGLSLCAGALAWTIPLNAAGEAKGSSRAVGGFDDR